MKILLLNNASKIVDFDIFPLLLQFCRTPKCSVKNSAGFFYYKFNINWNSILINSFTFFHLFTLKAISYRTMNSCKVVYWLLQNLNLHENRNIFNTVGIKTCQVISLPWLIFILRVTKTTKGLIEEYVLQLKFTYFM